MSTPPPAPNPAQSRPNVLWIFGDQHRAAAQSHMGDPNLNTPNIDRLAASGLCSTAAVAGTPLCCPARGTLLTGRYPHCVVPGHELQLPPDQPTLAQAFKAHGYDTAWFGKWHLDGFKEVNGRAAMHLIPPNRRGGFDDWVGYENNNAPWDCWVHGQLNGQPVPHHRLPGFETDALTAMLIDYLRQRAPGGARSNPFFAALSVQPPHDPYLAPPEYMARHNPARISLRPNVPAIPAVIDTARRDLAGYYAMIENLDDNLGRIFHALTAAGLAENTHIVFFSDHGDMHGSQGLFRKTNPFEESIRVPFIMGGLSAYHDRRNRLPLLVNQADLAPTTLGLCGITPPTWMQGTDLSAFRLRDRPIPAEPDSALLQLVIPTGHQDSIDRPWRGIVTNDGWKYCCVENAPWLLFNLHEDPFEQANNVHNSRYRAVRKRLHDRLGQWLSDLRDPFALPHL